MLLEDVGDTKDYTCYYPVLLDSYLYFSSPKRTHNWALLHRDTFTPVVMVSKHAGAF